MITLNSIVEIREQIKGVWYVRIVLDKDGQELESDFIKLHQTKLPSQEDIDLVVEKYLETRNVPAIEVIEPAISDEIPDEELGLTKEQATVLNTIWVPLKDWFSGFFEKK